MNHSFIYLFSVINGSPCFTVAVVENVDNVPFEFLGQKVYIAKATDAEFNPVDEGFGKIIYSWRK